MYAHIYFPTHKVFSAQLRTHTSMYFSIAIQFHVTIALLYIHHIQLEKNNEIGIQKDTQGSTLQ